MQEGRKEVKEVKEARRTSWLSFAAQDKRQAPVLGTKARKN